MLFGKKKEKTQFILPPAESLLLQKMESNQATSAYEKQFFIAFEDALRVHNIDHQCITVKRMGSGSIRCSVSAGIIGTIHLRTQFGSIQYFVDPLKIHQMQDAPVEAVIAVIPYWIKYLQGLLRLRKAAMTP